MILKLLQNDVKISARKASTGETTKATATPSMAENTGPTIGSISKIPATNPKKERKARLLS